MEVYTCNMAKKQAEEATMAQVRALFEDSKISLQELGLRMGYPEATARQSVWQFIYKTDDPRLSMLKRFAKAMGVSVKDLV
jgi:transcriptional regulator with XRE-family HTH domain